MKGLLLAALLLRPAPVGAVTPASAMPPGPGAGVPAPAPPKLPRRRPRLLALPAPRTTESYPLDFSADYTSYIPETGFLLAVGHVHIRYRDIAATGDRLSGNVDKGQFQLNGGVQLQQGGRSAEGESLAVDLKRDTWEFEGGRALFQPQGLLQPLRITGQDVRGAPALLQSGPVSITTCDRPRPHYHFQGRSFRVIPGRRLEIRGAALYIGRTHVLGWPRLVIPLRAGARAEGRTNIIPEFGENNIEGAYVHIPYNYATSRTGTGTARLDLMSRLGAALGIDQRYRLGTGSGRLVLRGLVNQAASGRELTGTLQHTQHLGPITADLQADIRQNSSYFLSNTRSSDVRLTLTRGQVGNLSSLAFQREDTSFGVGSYVRDTLSFSHAQTFGHTDAQLGLSLFQSITPTSPDRELESSLKLFNHGSQADVTLAFNRRDALIATPQGFFASLDRLPELTLQTDHRRFKGGLFSYVPASVNLSFGQFREEPTNVQTTRLAFDAAIDPQRWRIGRSEAQLNLGFRQSVYGGYDSAQYVLTGSARWSSNPKGATAVELLYNLSKPEGYTPFRFDQPANFNTALANLRWKTGPLRIALGSGVDLRGGPSQFQDLIFRGSYGPAGPVLFTLSTAFDPNRSRFRDVVDQLRVRAGRFLLDLGTRYSSSAGRLSALRWHLDTPLVKHYHLETVGGYNGFTRKFDYRVFSLTREWHDWTVSLNYVDNAGFQTQRGLGISLSFKAFPTYHNIAVGDSGQPLDTQLGDVF